MICTFLWEIYSEFFFIYVSPLKFTITEFIIVNVYPLNSRIQENEYCLD
jgi:hypothetical protein